MQKRIAKTLMMEQFGLGFVGGFCDTVGFIALSGLFTAHVTGNLILAGANVLHYEGEGVVPNLLMIPVFVLAIGVITVVARSPTCLSMTVATRTRCFLIAQLVMLLAFWWAGQRAVAAHGFPLHAAQDVLPVAAIGVSGMAIQNALTRITGSTALPTTIMTGNLTQAAFSAFSLITLRRRKDAEDWTKEVSALKALAPGVLGFFVGAAIAAPLTFAYRFDGMLVCCLALGATTMVAGHAPQKLAN